MTLSLPANGVRAVLVVSWLVRYRTLLVSLLVGVLALAFFLSVLPRNITWVSAGGDGPNLMLAAKYWTISHATGQPLYTVLSALWLRLVPLGSDWWRLALMSAFFASATAGLLYTITRSWLAPLVFISAGVVVSQSSIVEVYSLVTFLIVLVWWLHQREYRSWAYAVVGLGLAVHHLVGYLFLALLIKDYLARRTLWPSLWAIIVGLPWYAYIPLANRPPYIFIAGESFQDYVHYFLGLGSQAFGLAVMDGRFSLSEDFRERIWDLARTLLALGPVLLLGWFAVRRQWRKRMVLLPILALLYAFHWFGSLDPVWFSYGMISMALLAIIVGQHQRNWQLRSVCVVFCLFAVALNLWLYDVGGLIDPDHSAEGFRAQLSELPENAAVWTNAGRGWEAVTVALYNADHGTHLDPIWVGHYNNLAGVEAAEAEGRLYHTVVVDAASYRVRIEPATAELVQREFGVQNLANRQ